MRRMRVCERKGYVGGREGGASYPKPGHLKKLIALGLQRHAFTAGCEIEEAQALWRTSYQKCSWMSYGCMPCLISRPRRWRLYSLSRPTLPTRCGWASAQLGRCT